jgi:hypothetical protein
VRRSSRLNNKGLTGNNRTRPGLNQDLAADTLVVPELDRLARSVPETSTTPWAPARGPVVAGRQHLRPGRPEVEDVLQHAGGVRRVRRDLLKMRTRVG